MSVFYDPVKKQVKPFVFITFIIIPFILIFLIFGFCKKLYNGKANENVEKTIDIFE